jgi:Kef-type K+ transport system membrane component KefB/nucleotide-binding universal stress UspA family protein
MSALLHNPLSLFLLQTVLIIGTSRVIGLATRRARQPMVIAEIVAGIMLGPSLLGWLAPGVSAVLFPAAGMPLLGMLSQVGLVLFMFLVGLEFDARMLRGRGHAAVAISHTSIIVPFALGAVLAHYLYPRLAPAGVPFSSFTLFMGVAMSITAFPVLARILVERRLLKTKIGAVAITCAAVDDVTAWCILAFVVSIVRAASLADGVRTTVLALAYVVFVLRIVKPLVERLAARSANKEGLSQNLVAVILMLVLLSSWTTEAIGIHALFGAFIFGAVVPKREGFAQLLADKLEDLVVVLMLPLFFAYSGLRTEIGLLDSAAAWTMCALVIAVACVGKFGGSFVAARLTGLGWRESAALGILMNTRGLMELIVLNIGLDLGVISPALFTMMVLMALVTTFVTSPLLARLYSTAATAPGSAIADDVMAAELAVAPGDGFRVLMCVAYDRSGPGMVTVAGALAGRTDDDHRLYALRLVPPNDRASFVLGQERATVEATALAPLLQRADALDLTVRPLSFVSGDPVRDICNVAAVKRADLVLLGWHKPILGRAVLSGTVHDVMRAADTTVAVLVDRGLGWTSRVLVPYRGGVHDRGALRLAARLAQQAGASVTILQICDPDPTRDASLTAADAVRDAMRDGPGDKGGHLALKLVEHTRPTNAVLEECENGYDLVVVGLGAAWGLEHRSFGLHAEELIRDCPASLLIVRQHDASVGADAEPGAVTGAPVADEVATGRRSS